MNIVDIIIKKRDKKALTKEEIEYFVKSAVNGEIADYQISALLMAIFINGLTEDETSFLTEAMVNSGDICVLSYIDGIKVDKHSTGGVGDTTTLIIAPIVAALGVPVIKMSGRGLGFSGGTIDKLDSIPNFRTSLSPEEVVSAAKKTGLVLTGQNQNLVPADKIFYALRDVTGTVDSIPLIVSSIMSKKLASGADSIVLDVKCGSGAFMKDYTSAKELALGMVNIGNKAGKKVTAVISSMEQPLGNYIGNSLEVIEAIEVLKGNTKGDLLEVCLTLGGAMLLNAQKVSTLEEGKALMQETINNGKGLEKFREFIKNQNGNPEIVDDYSLLPLGKVIKEVYSPKDGYVSKMDTALIGEAMVETGAGRHQKADPVDYGAGIIMNVRIGGYIKKGDVLAKVYSSSEEKALLAEKLLYNAFTISDTKSHAGKLILDII